MKTLNRRIALIFSFMNAFVLIPLCVCACGDIVHSEKPQIDYLSIDELYRLCMPAECGKDVVLEGKEVHVRGSVDRNNVFDKQSYPRLPYEKFKIYDKKSGKAVDVRAVSKDNRFIFKKIEKYADVPDRDIFVSGVVSSFDMPIMGKCKRGIRIEIKDAGKIIFK